jgi:hypothetical protein
MRISTIIGYFKCFIHQTYLYHNYPSYICQPPIPIRLKSQSLIGIKLTHLRETYLHPTVIPSNPTFKAISTKATTYLQLDSTEVINVSDRLTVEYQPTN